MFEILILGRGGQGAQTAGNQLAQAFFAEGRYVQTFSTYGGARRGTPVTASLRVDRQPIRQRCNITSATAVLCFDDSLLDDGVFGQTADGAVIVVNSARARDALPAPAGRQVVAVDGLLVAQRNGMGRLVNSALLGAFVAAFGEPGLDTICAVIAATAPGRTDANLAACRDAHALLQSQPQEA